MNMQFKNSVPQVVNTPWQGVELFLQTWGDLPGRPGFGKRLMELEKQDLADLCELALDAAARLGTDGRYIKTVQQEIIELGLYKDKA